jgi:hypothetical protein
MQIAARGAFKEAMGTGSGSGKCGARLLEPIMKVRGGQSNTCFLVVVVIDLLWVRVRVRV